MSNKSGFEDEDVAVLDHEEARVVTEPEDSPEVIDLEPKAEDDAGTVTKQHGGALRRKKTLLIGAGLLIAALVGGYFVRNAFLYEDTDDAQVDGHIMPLSARIRGQVQEVRVIECQLVHAGDILVVIDPKDYKIAVDQAKANLADAEASAASSMWSVPVTSATAWSTLDSSQTAIHNAEAGVEAAEQNLESAKAVLL